MGEQVKELYNWARRSKIMVAFFVSLTVRRRSDDWRHCGADARTIVHRLADAGGGHSDRDHHVGTHLGGPGRYVCRNECDAAGGSRSYSFIKFLFGHCESRGTRGGEYRDHADYGTPHGN